MTRHAAAPKLPPTCPQQIRGQVAGAGSCPLMGGVPRLTPTNSRPDLHVHVLALRRRQGAARGQLGGRYSTRLPAGRGQVGAARGQLNPATCPQQKQHLTWPFTFQGAVRAGNCWKFCRCSFTESDITAHLDRRKGLFTSPQKSLRENLPLLPPGGARWH